MWGHIRNVEESEVSAIDGLNTKGSMLTMNLKLDLLEFD
jgi:hypothetical protein